MNNSVFIDIILVVVFVLFCFLGYKRGLMLSIFAAGSTIISLVVSILIYPAVSAVLEKTPLYDAVNARVTESLSGVGAGLANSTNSTINEYINSMSLPDVIKENLLEQFSNTSSEYAVVDIVKSLSTVVTDLIIDIISIILLFIIVSVIMFFVKRLLVGVAKFPVIKHFDKAGGLVFGFVEAFVLVTVVAAIFSYISTTFDSAAFIESLNNSVLGNYFYNNNVILNIISGKPLEIPMLSLKE